jgi:ketosteroid isomerase-like protein
MDSIRVTVRSVGFSGLRLSYAGTMYVEFETDQVTTDGIAFHTEVLGVYRFRSGKLAYYREYLYDSSRLEEVWGPSSPVSPA